MERLSGAEPDTPVPLRKAAMARLLADRDSGGWRAGAGNDVLPGPSACREAPDGGPRPPGPRNGGVELAELAQLLRFEPGAQRVIAWLALYCRYVQSPGLESFRRRLDSLSLETRLYLVEPQPGQGAELAQRWTIALNDLEGWFVDKGWMAALPPGPRCWYCEHPIKHGESCTSEHFYCCAPDREDLGCYVQAGEFEWYAAKLAELPQRPTRWLQQIGPIPMFVGFDRRYGGIK